MASKDNPVSEGEFLQFVEGYVSGQADIRDRFDSLDEELARRFDRIEKLMARHSAAIEALARAQPLKVRQAVHDAQAAVVLAD